MSELTRVHEWQPPAALVEIDLRPDVCLDGDIQALTTEAERVAGQMLTAGASVDDMNALRRYLNGRMATARSLRSVR